MLAGTVTTARLDRVLTTTALGLGDHRLTATATELELARNRTNEVSNEAGHLSWFIYLRECFFPRWRRPPFAAFLVR